MTYPPGNPGYPPPPPPGPYGAFNPGLTRSADDSAKLPQYLQLAVVALGLASYLASFGPMLTVVSGASAGPVGRINLVVPLAVLAALLAAVGLLPKAKNYAPIVAVLSTLAALLAVTRVVTKSDVLVIGWALWLILGLTTVQAVSAIMALLLDAGVVAAPSARSKYGPYTGYGSTPAGGYYGQSGPPGGPHTGPHGGLHSGLHGGQHGRGPQTGPQQPGYPSYGGYPPGSPAGGFGPPSGPPTGGFGAGARRSEPSGPPTPPTGFPNFGQPPAGGSATGGGQGHGSQAASNAGQPGPGRQSQGAQAGQSSPATGSSTESTTGSESNQP